MQGAVMAGGCGHSRLEGHREQLGCHGCVLWELQSQSRQIRRGDVPYVFPSSCPRFHVPPITPSGEKAAERGLRRQAAEASPLDTEQSQRMQRDSSGRTGPVHFPQVTG